MGNDLQLWWLFAIFASALLILDLFLNRGDNKVPSLRWVSVQIAGWVSAAMLFGGIIYHYKGFDKFLEYLTGYIVELSLSMDNVFVFVLIFNYFRIPMQYQHRVLFLGVMGAILMRLVMISFGVLLVQQFTWIFGIFGLILIFSAYKIIHGSADAGIQEDGKMVRLLSKYINFTPKLHGQKFVITQEGKRYFTPLFLVLILVEKTDLIFALDSIPAILAITQDPFIVFSSNIFAILGLRALYFLLAQIMHLFVYLKYGLSFILAFIGVKMILAVFHIHMATWAALCVIIAALTISIVASLRQQKS